MKYEYVWKMDKIKYSHSQQHTWDKKYYHIIHIKSFESTPEKSSIGI